jgi:hypothetical protein
MISTVYNRIHLLQVFKDWYIYLIKLGMTTISIRTQKE